MQLHNSDTLWVDGCLMPLENLTGKINNTVFHSLMAHCVNQGDSLWSWLDVISWWHEYERPQPSVAKSERFLDIVSYMGQRFSQTQFDRLLDDAIFMHETTTLSAYQIVYEL